jgi:formylmethanofuran dehydrogenase subunit E
MLLGYQRMSFTELFVWQPVILTTPAAVLLSRPGARTICDRCGEEILNERQVAAEALTLCRHCAFGGYYHAACDAATDAAAWPVAAPAWPRTQAVPVADAPTQEHSAALC